MSLNSMRPRQLVAFTLCAIVIAFVILAVTQLTPSPHQHVRSRIRPISIQRDSDFVADHGVVAGSGTIFDPYIIEGWDIDSSLEVCSKRPCAAIAVQNVRASFIIRDVNVTAGRYDHGVSLSGVSNAKVEKTSVTGVVTGLRAASSTNLTLSGNVILGTEEGIYLSQVQDVVAVGNNVSQGNQGIVIEDSSRVMLFDNNVSNNAANGILLTHVENSTLEGNTISETAFRAIALFDSSGIVVSGNRILGSGEECLYLLRGREDSLVKNEISSCAWAGISVNTSNDNLLRDNFVNATRWGIAVSDSCGNEVVENRVSNVSLVGITSDTDCNLVIGNNVTVDTFAGRQTPLDPTIEVQPRVIHQDETITVTGWNCMPNMPVVIRLDPTIDSGSLPVPAGDASASGTFSKTVAVTRYIQQGDVMVWAVDGRGWGSNIIWITLLPPLNASTSESASPTLTTNNGTPLAASISRETLSTVSMSEKRELHADRSAQVFFDGINLASIGVPGVIFRSHLLTKEGWREELNRKPFPLMDS